MERNRLARIAHHRDANEVAIADDAAGRIEIDPAGSGQIDLSPSIRIAAMGIAPMGITAMPVAALPVAFFAMSGRWLAWLVRRTDMTRS